MRRLYEALEAIKEAEALVEVCEEVLAELRHQHRKAAEVNFTGHTREATYAEYCCQKGEILKLGASNVFVMR